MNFSMTDFKNLNHKDDMLNHKKTNFHFGNQDRSRTLEHDKLPEKQNTFTGPPSSFPVQQIP
jgi:hypothetical protein